MTDQPAVRARRVPAIEEPLIGADRYDYADTFEIRAPDGDARSAERFIRSALEEAAWPVPSTMRLVHRHVARFRLGPRSSPDHLLGWRIVSSERDVIELETDSPILRAVIVVRRAESAWRVTTYLFYSRPAAARLLWTLIGPLHRRIAPYLLERAAASANQVAHPAAVRA